MLETFGMQQGGTQYRRLMGAFQRIFGATIFFGTDTQRERATVIHRARFSFMSEARIWYSRNSPRSPASYRTKSFSARNSSARSWSTRFRPTRKRRGRFRVPLRRSICRTVASLQKGRECVPLFGPRGLVNQLGSSDYARPRRFREKLAGWIDLVRALWPECPAGISSDGTGLWVDRANAVLTNEVSNVRCG
jgi:hypothetical protein